MTLGKEAIWRWEWTRCIYIRRAGGTKGKVVVEPSQKVVFWLMLKPNGGYPEGPRAMERCLFWAWSLRGDAAFGGDLLLTLKREEQCPGLSFPLFFRVHLVLLMGSTSHEAVGKATWGRGEGWRVGLRAACQLICTVYIWTRWTLSFLSSLTNKNKAPTILKHQFLPRKRDCHTSRNQAYLLHPIVSGTVVHRSPPGVTW